MTVDHDTSENPLEERPGQYARLLPQRFFDDRFHDTDPDETLARSSPTVRRRLASSCAGWPAPHPTSEELYDALRANAPTERETAIIGVWTDEATEEEIVDAWNDNVYSWSILARGMRTIGRERAPNHLIVNTHSRWTGAESPEETWGP